MPTRRSEATRVETRSRILFFQIHFLSFIKYYWFITLISFTFHYKSINDDEQQYNSSIIITMCDINE